MCSIINHRILLTILIPILSFLIFFNKDLISIDNLFHLNDGREILKQLFNKSSEIRLPKDIVFIVGSNQQELSSNYLLSKINDDRFAQIFTAPVNDTRKRIKIKYIKPIIFINLLTYIYDNELTLDDLADFSATYHLAKQYSLDELCIELMNYIDKKLSIYTSIIIYDQLLKLNNDNLNLDKKLNELMNIINVHAYLAFMTNDFTRISKDTLIKLLQSDQLIIREKDVYYACLRWIHKELIRQNLNDFSDKLNLFNSIKHLIRFPIMSYHQFFFARREKRSHLEQNMYFEFCPGQSGLFDENELKSFYKYFETKESKWLPNYYNTKNRNQIKIGELELIGDHIKRYEFKMNTKINDQCCGDRDAESYFTDWGNNYESVLSVDLDEIKSEKITTKLRENDLIISNNSIRVFRINIDNMISWPSGEHLLIYENNELLSTFYVRYAADLQFGYYDYWPSFELKKGSVYTFSFVVPGHRVDKISFRLENIYTKINDKQRKLDIKFKHVDGINSWSNPRKIFFFYK